MKKVMLSLIVVMFSAIIFSACTEEEVKPNTEGTKTESNPKSWD